MQDQQSGALGSNPESATNISYDFFFSGPQFIYLYHEEVELFQLRDSVSH